jgi:excisionase family DNA binding protein
MGEWRLDESELRPLVKSVVAEVLMELEQLKKTHDGRLAYTEAEAANMLGLKQHQLRDIRRNGKIGHTRIVGKRIRYTLQDLMAYLNCGREGASAARQC